MLERSSSQGYLRRLGAAAIEPSRAIRPLTGPVFEASRATAKMPDVWPGFPDGGATDEEKLAEPVEIRRPKERVTSTVSPISLDALTEGPESPITRTAMAPQHDGPSVPFPLVSVPNPDLRDLPQSTGQTNQVDGSAREAVPGPHLDASTDLEAQPDATLQAAVPMAAPFTLPTPTKSAATPAHLVTTPPALSSENTIFASYAAAPQTPDRVRSENFPQASVDHQPTRRMGGAEPQRTTAEAPHQPIESDERRRGETRIEPPPPLENHPRMNFASFHAEADRRVPTSAPTAIRTAAPAPPDEIHIHIGRIEITAVPPAVAPVAPNQPRKTLSLDEYLKRGR